jgi:hypothetical protein
MKPVFNKLESLKLCPPNDREIHKKIRKECHFVDRRIIDVDKVEYRTIDQVRVLKVVQNNAACIKISMQTHGYLHSEYPPVIIENPDKPGYYIGIVGHTRNQVIRELGYDYMIYDVYKFDTPKARTAFSGGSNKIYNPRTGNTKDDILYMVLKSIDSGEISNEDSDIIDFISIVADDKSLKEREKIYDAIRARKSKYATLATYHTGEGLNSTTEAAQKYGIPYKGSVGFKTTGRYGYISEKAYPKTSFTNAKQILAKDGWQTIEFYFYIPKPNSETLNTQRRDMLNAFNAALAKEAQWIQIFLLEKFNKKISIDEIIDLMPYEYMGFLPQNLEPDPKKGGRPTENTIVDWDGTPMNKMPKKAILTKVLKFGT